MTVGIVLVSDVVVNGKKNLHTLSLCLVKQLVCKVELVILTERGADLVTACLVEGISHSAADDEGVNLLNEVVDDTDLVGDLCAAENCDERAFRIAKRVTHYGDFLLDEVATYCREVVGNTGR